MKKLIFLVSITVVFAFVTSPAMAVKPAGDKCATIQGGTITDTSGNTVTVGYDQWGYNYQANMFNGWYGNYSRPVTPVTEGDNLMMKWNDAWLSSKDCDGDGKLDRHFGFPSYQGSGAWLTNHASGTYQTDWNLDGNWGLDFDSIKYPSGSPYGHTLIIIGTNATGSSVGNTYKATVSVTGNLVTIVATYESGSAAYPYTYTATGIISSAGTMSGTWIGSDGDSGTWNSSSGTAVKGICEWKDFVKIVAVSTLAVPQPDVINCPLANGLDGEMWYDENETQIGCSIWGEFALIQEVSSDPCGEFNLKDYKSQLRSGLGNW